MPTAALWEQLAEECTELAHAALKAARVLRRENPTPVSISDALDSVREEFTDVKLIADVIGLEVDEDILQEKIDRWFYRLEKYRRGK